MKREQAIKSFDRVTVVMHTYDRPEFFSDYVSDGRWSDAPLLIVDDGSSDESLGLLREAAERQGATLHHYDRNGGVAHATSVGAKLVTTPYMMMVGDDDYFVDFRSFVEQALSAMEDEETLVAVMPQIVAFDDKGNRQTQYDRTTLDGIRAGDLLRRLVESGELLALQAGSLMRTDAVRASVSEDFFRVSEDFVLFCRLCAHAPEKKVRVVQSGTYMRRVHARSLTARHRSSQDNGFIHFVSLFVGAFYLIQSGVLCRQQFAEILRKRGAVLEKVHDHGRAAAEVLADLVLGRRARDVSDEAGRLASFLQEHGAELPPEFSQLIPNFDEIVRDGPQLSPQNETARQAASADIVTAIGRDQLAEARRLLSAYRTDYGADLDYSKLAAALASRMGRRDEALRIIMDATAVGGDSEALCIAASLLEDEGRLEEAATYLVEASRSAGPEERGAITAAADRLSRKGVAVDFPRCRLGIVVQEGFDAFLGDLVRELGAIYAVKVFKITSRQDVDRAMEWSDVVWFEWCSEPLIYGSRHPLAASKKLVCRIHRFEAFTDMPQRIEWSHVDVLVAVAPHVASIVAESIPRLRERTAVHVIPNGVNLDEYDLIEAGPGFNVAYVGYLHMRKNPALLLQILRRLVDKDDRYQLFVAGRFQEPVLKLYWNHMVRELGLEKHVHFDGWQEDIACWLADKNYVLSTSIHESFGYGIAEAMARGIKPVVHNFAFAGEIWPEEILFNTVDEAVGLIEERDYDSSLYRAFIAEHYSLESQIARTTKLIDRIAPVASYQKSANGARPNRTSRIVAFRPAATGAYLSLSSGNDATSFDVYQGTIGGLAIGVHEAPNGQSVTVRPEEFVAALEELLPRFDYDEALERSRSAESVALSWFDRGNWAEVMDYDGLNLGACMGYDIMPWILSGITHD